MSFGVYLQRFENGESSQVRRQPVLAVLLRTTYRGPDKFGYYHVEFSDGGHVEFSASGLESNEPFDGCAFNIRNFGDDLLRFILEVARAGDMVVLPAMESSPLIFVHAEQKVHVPADMVENFHPIEVQSIEELRKILVDGFQAWWELRERSRSRSQNRE